MIKKETRLMEIRAAAEPDDQKMIVEGYAIRFNEPAIFNIGGAEYREIIKPEALDGADMQDIVFRYNHSNNIMIMARTRNNTLQFIRDEEGLFVRAELADTTAGRDLYNLIRRGDIDKMSFAFTVDYENGGDEYDRKTRTRIIKRIKRIYDVSAVDIPAYDTTSISARNFFEMKREQEILRDELIIKTYL